MHKVYNSSQRHLYIPPLNLGDNIQKYVFMSTCLSFRAMKVYFMASIFHMCDKDYEMSILPCFHLPNID